MSGACLAVYEELIWEQAKNMFWDMVDGDNKAKHAKEARAYVKREGKLPSMGQTGGVRVVFPVEMDKRWKRNKPASPVQPIGLAEVSPPVPTIKVEINGDPVKEKKPGAPM